MWKRGLRVTRKLITPIAKEKNPQHSANVSEQTHSTENYGSPLRLDTSNSSSPQPTLESKVQIEVGTLKELVYCMCVSTGRLMLQLRNVPLPLPLNE